MEQKTKIYLAHPFNSRKVIRRWQIKIQKENKNIKFFNAFYPKRKSESWNAKDFSEDNYYKKLDDKDIVEQDIRELKKCQIVIAIIDGNISYGTIQEIVYGYLMGKKIYLLCTNGHHNHPWLKYHSSKIFKKFEQAEKWLKTL